MSLIHDSLRRQEPDPGQGREHRRALSAERVLAPLGYERAAPRRRGFRALLAVALALLGVLAAWTYLGRQRAEPHAVVTTEGATEASPARARDETSASRAQEDVPEAETAARGDEGVPPVGPAVDVDVAAPPANEETPQRPLADLFPGDIELPLERAAPARANLDGGRPGEPVTGSANVGAHLVASSAPSSDELASASPAPPPAGVQDEAGAGEPAREVPTPPAPAAVTGSANVAARVTAAGPASPEEQPLVAAAASEVPAAPPTTAVTGSANVAALLTAAQPTFPEDQPLVAIAADEVPTPPVPAAVTGSANVAAHPTSPAVQPPVSLAEGAPSPEGTAEPEAAVSAANEPDRGATEQQGGERRPPGDIFLPREAPAQARVSGPEPSETASSEAVPMVTGNANVAAGVAAGTSAPGEVESGAEPVAEPAVVARAEPPEAVQTPSVAPGERVPTSRDADPGERRPPGDIFLPRETPSATERAHLDRAPDGATQPPVPGPLADRDVLPVAPAASVAAAKEAPPAPALETTVTSSPQPSPRPTRQAEVEGVVAQARSLPGDIILPRERRQTEPAAPATVGGDSSAATVATLGPAGGTPAAEPATGDRPAIRQPERVTASATPGASVDAGVGPEGLRSRASAPAPRPTRRERSASQPKAALSRLALATSTARSASTFGELPPAPPPPVFADANAAMPETDDFRLAVHAQRAGDADAALGHYRTVLDRNDRNAEAHNNLGVLLQQRDRLEEARRAFERAIALDPGHVAAHNNLGVLDLRLGRPDRAAGQFRTALESDPRNVDAMVNLAIALRAGGRPAESREMLLHAVALERANPAAHYNLGLLYDESGDSSSAVAHYRQFLQYRTIDSITLAADVRRRIDVLAGGTR